MSAHEPAERPAEQLPIALFESVVLAVRSADARIYLGLRDLCLALGIDLSSQRRRIVANPSLHLRAFRVRSGRQLRTLDFLLLDDLGLWILSIQELRVNAAVAERLVYIKRYLEAAVRKAFAELTGLPDAPSTTIEELRDLDRIDVALAQLALLAQRQDTLEHSQDRARAVFRDLLDAFAGLRQLPDEIAELRTRVQELEQQARSRITASQRDTLYQMVQRWGEARAVHDSKLTTGVAIRRCWVELNQRFELSTYSHLPAAKYDEAIQFVKQQYHAVTGHDIDAIEQSGLDL